MDYKFDCRILKLFAVVLIYFIIIIIIIFLQFKKTKTKYLSFFPLAPEYCVDGIEDTFTSADAGGKITVTSGDGVAANIFNDIDANPFTDNSAGKNIDIVMLMLKRSPNHHM